MAVSPILGIFTGSLSAQAHSYLRNMMYICTYYMVGKSVNATVIAGVFCAGGDTTFGLKCDAVIKLPAVYAHYKKYRWVRNLTENEATYDSENKAELV